MYSNIKSIKRSWNAGKDTTIRDVREGGQRGKFDPGTRLKGGPKMKIRGIQSQKFKSYRNTRKSPGYGHQNLTGGGGEHQRS